jgi:hypothetical protein
MADLLGLGQIVFDTFTRQMRGQRLAAAPSGRSLGLRAAILLRFRLRRCCVLLGFNEQAALNAVFFARRREALQLRQAELLFEEAVARLQRRHAFGLLRHARGLRFQPANIVAQRGRQSGKEVGWMHARDFTKTNPVLGLRHLHVSRIFFSIAPVAPSAGGRPRSASSGHR